MFLINKLIIYKGDANFAISNMIGSFVSMISGIVAAAYIDPEDFGVIQSILLIATYVSFLQLGVFNGLNRNLAYYRAKGNFVKMQKAIDTSHTVSIFVSIIGAFIGIISIIYFLFYNYSKIYILSSGMLFVFLVFNPLINHIECTYRSGQQFNMLANIKHGQNVISLLTSTLPIWFGALGKLISDIAKNLFVYYFELRYLPYPHKSNGSKKSFQELVSVGLPLLISGYIWGVFVVSDKTFIATHMTAKDMGMYSLSGYCISLFMVLPTALNTLLYPKAAARFGKTDDKKTLLPLWWKSLVLFSFVIIPLAGFSYLIIPCVVECLLPKYYEGISVARISLLTCCTFVSMGPSVIFGTLKKNISYILMIFICLGLFWLIVTLFPNKYTTIESVAWLRFYISILLMLFVIFYTYYLITK